MDMNHYLGRREGHMPFYLHNFLHTKSFQIKTKHRTKVDMNNALFEFLSLSQIGLLFIFFFNDPIIKSYV